MRVAIAGAGKVGRAIARELVSNGHEVLLIDREPAKAEPDVVHVLIDPSRRGDHAAIFAQGPEAH